AIATVDSLTGVVTGASGGVATIYYSTGVACTASASVIVIPLANAGVITGSPNGCPGVLTVLNDTVAGGIWSNSSSAVATVSSGIVHGVSPGTDTVSYIYTNVCGSDTAIKVITINVLPHAGSITGISGICLGTSTSLSDTVSGGVWSSSLTSIADVSSSGKITSISPG